MGLPTGADKETSRAMALRLWPSLASSLARKRDEGRAEALLLAESMTVPDFRGVMNHVQNGELHATGKVIEEITDDQRQYYGFDVGAFGKPPGGGRVMLLLSYP